ncbi:tripartite tricarboxylate transporter substrate-binding protein [Rhodococcus sp. IEGM 1401]|uniref:Bug family tripartite tricarboxylate transporter substrate binding protein n=1 Tax=unclassified Rhodococcus (in: high G+C Gram-positive bacteria) TaxID=192944 RepID=UPI0011EBDB1E|nr:MULTISPECIES: tripartite tricarboxylate transporter substrate-binding protein [unclassified Rhodococcus (in: high G+C Gram-positive bacteria)]KAA0927579.1 tripartite tricarboxylate transporter substrate binding protein [Rhodococcus sp. ANT_H53B]MCZ4562521.1 tripartite tricarboxylate transporter substrate-binding protein [Rhodococcus sp. IEGM 1401]MDI9922564.1 tripartite tricarboxylate transporter substrate-binding protein [Rhodococcus sp. IEGM 1372]MDI9926959.1 tripartite tricarboxylate tran
MAISPTLLRTAGALVVVGAVTVAGIDAARSASGSDARAKLTLIAPAAAGGGWDLVARESQQALRSDGIVNNAQVVNVPGAGGTIGLSQLDNLSGQPTTVMITGTVMLGGIAINNSETTLADTVPIAKLAEDFEVFVVPKDSPIQNLEDMIEAWRANPGGLPIGGGSLGGIDHIVAGQLAQEADIDPAAINYIAYSGGGEVLTSLLSNTVGVAVSGFNDFRDQIEAGNVRALAVAAPEPLEGFDVETFIEQGYNVDLVNWRGIVAPPGISDEDRQTLVDIVTEMVETEQWATAVERNRWKESVLTGDEFGEFLEVEQTRITGILEELGLV